jgi:hypothetical protein
MTLGDFGWSAASTQVTAVIWPPFAVGAMSALRTPNCDYAARLVMR